MVERGSLTLGELLLFNSYVLMLVGPLRLVGMTLSQLQRALVSAALIGRLLDVEPTLTDPPRPKRLPDDRGELRFEGVTSPTPGTHRPCVGSTSPSPRARPWRSSGRPGRARARW
jgi:ABC-type multidrug transport system fused ATPase/permease subunit